MAGTNQQASEEIERALEPFKEDSWAKRRLNLDEVIGRLEQALGPDDRRRQGGQSSARRELFAEYISFIGFLRDHCAGQQFSSDKQWGHLLNLMSISRKVNQRTAKFKDVLKSKSQIEANARAIRSFNESVRLAGSIDKALAELSAQLDSSHLGVEVAYAVPINRRLLLAEISKAECHLDNMCGPIVYNLGVQLQSKSMSSLFDSERGAWTDKFRLLEASFGSLVQFLRHYHELQKSLIELEPLLQSLEGLQRPRAAGGPGSGGKSESLQSMLVACTAEFTTVVGLDRSILNTLQAQLKPASQGARGEVKRAQQVLPLKLAKLLDSRGCLKRGALSEGLLDARQITARCQSSLAEIKQNLRLEFGRFYFINDIELLQLMALDVRLIEESGKPERERLIRKIFNNSIRSFVMHGEAGEESATVVGVVNSIGERIEFYDEEPVRLRKRVNVYSLELVRVLNEILRKLRRSLRQTLKASLDSWLAAARFGLCSPSNDIDWSLQVQLLELAEQAKFTHRVERALAEGSDLACLLEFYEARLGALQSMTCVPGLSDKGEKLIGINLSAAISVTVHIISALLELKSSACSSIDSWSWLKLARFYAKHTDSPDLPPWQLEVRLANARFDYRFDLLVIETTSSSNSLGGARDVGAGLKRLIRTETSDKCFLVASQAISKLKFGASPFGPAGSGKTETIKALGTRLGCQVVVHNCDETNDSESLERLVWGLAHTGLWGCFDEFNRLSASSLSSVSSVLEIVQANLGSQQATLELAGGQIKSVDPDSAFFITLNPGDAFKYRGRRRLPANLRALFLPIAMYRVQIEAIVREMLLVPRPSSSQPSQLNGKLEAAVAADIGRKLSDWIWLAQSGLKQSCFNRCEFDLRLVLVILKRLFLLAGANKGDSETTHELLVRSISAEVGPRLRRAEVVLFEEGLESIFKIAASLEGRQSPVDRSSQLKDQLESRSGVILLGETRSGKSTCWQNLANELNKTNRRVCWSALNPKAYDKSKLFGSFESATRSWVDGSLTKLVRGAAAQLEAEPSLQQAWIVLDGCIDPDWVECLNSVLDDNQVLTLSSGERINFVIAPNKVIKLLFETDHIDYASPATISRLGLVLHERESNHAGRANRASAGKGLSLTIVQGGASDESRLCRANELAGHQEATIVFRASDLSNSQSLVEMLRLSAGKPYTFILHNLGLIQHEDVWGTRSLVEMLKHVITYGYYQDQEQNEISLSAGTRFIVTANSLSDISNKRLEALATSIEVADSSGACGGPVRISSEALGSLLKSSLNEFDGPKVLVLTDENSTRLLRDVLELVPADEAAELELLRVSSSAAQSKCLDKLDNLAKLRTGSAPAPANERCLLVASSLELLSLELGIKRRLYQLINLLEARRLIGNQIRFVLCLDRAAEQEARFWSSFGRSFEIEPKMAGDAKLFGALKLRRIEPKDEKSLNWLAKAVIKSGDIRDQFIEILADMIATLGENSKTQSRLLTGGLQRLVEFEVKIEQIKASRRDEDAALEEKKERIGRMMADIDDELAKCALKKQQFGRLEELRRTKSSELEAQGGRIQRELEQVLRSIEASKREVSSCLKPEALNEIKTLRAPPKTIKDILDVLFMLLDIRDTSWATIKAYLARNSLREELTSYDFERRLDGNKLKMLELEIERRRDSFGQQQAKRASSAIVPILKWIEAALQYGRVVVRLEPLCRARDELKRDSDELAESMAQLEKERAQLDEKVKRDTECLEQARAEHGAAVVATKRIETELAQAQTVVDNLRQQVARCRRRLALADRLTRDEAELYRVCFACAALVVAQNSVGSLVALLSDLGVQAESGNEARTFGRLLSDYVNPLLDMIEEEPLEVDTVEPGRWVETARLVRIKLTLAFPHYPLFPLLSFARAQAASTEELVKLVSSRNVLSARDELTVVRPAGANFNNWRQSIDLGAQMNKLILLEFEQVNLDVLDTILQQHGKSRIVLFGRSSRIPQALERMVIEIRVDEERHCASQLDLCALVARISDAVMRHCRPETSDEILELEGSLRLKQREAKRLESSLLNELGRLGGGVAEVAPRGAQTAASWLQSGPVRVLSELQGARDALNASIGAIRAKLEGHQAGRDKFAHDSSRLAKFYLNFLAPLREADEFYSFSVERAVGLLVGASRGSSDPTLALVPAELESLLTKMMCALRPGCRAKFAERLLVGAGELASLVGGRRDQLVQTIQNSSKRSASLSEVLTDLFLGCPRWPGFCELAIVLHDERRPSPQVVLDELFRCWEGAVSASVECRYHKVYATSAHERPSGDAAVGGASTSHQLEQQLRLLLTPPGPSTGLATAPAAAIAKQAKTRLKCICVANAHLAWHWMNTRLLALIKEFEQTGGRGEKLLFLLVGEWCDDQARPLAKTTTPAAARGEPAQERHGPGPNMLEAAALKCWHEELALRALDRYNLYRNLLLPRDAPAPRAQSGSKRAGSPAPVTESEPSWEATIVESLALFHVVCQELLRLRPSLAPELGGEEFGAIVWRRDYNFDYEQLSLAVRVLKQVDRAQEEAKRHDLFCHLLESIVYGARLETVEDERLLARLLARFVRPVASATVTQERLSMLERLPGAEQATGDAVAAGARLASALARLIGATSGEN